MLSLHRLKLSLLRRQFPLPSFFLLLNQLKKLVHTAKISQKQHTQRTKGSLLPRAKSGKVHYFPRIPTGADLTQRPDTPLQGLGVEPSCRRPRLIVPDSARRIARLRRRRRHRKLRERRRSRRRRRICAGGEGVELEPANIGVGLLGRHGRRRERRRDPGDNCPSTHFACNNESFSWEPWKVKKRWRRQRRWKVGFGASGGF